MTYGRHVWGGAGSAHWAPTPCCCTAWRTAWNVAQMVRRGDEATVRRFGFGMHTAWNSPLRCSIRRPTDFGAARWLPPVGRFVHPDGPEDVMLLAGALGSAEAAIDFEGRLPPLSGQQMGWMGEMARELVSHQEFP